MNPNRNYLTEEQKVEIWVAYKTFGAKWVDIGNKLNVNPETARSFVNRYKKTHVLSPKKGPHYKITKEDEAFITDLVDAEPETTLLDLEVSTNISTTTCKSVLNKNGYIYTSLIPMCRLTPQHKINRITFSRYFVNLPLWAVPPIVFSDESTVCVNLKKPGIWRKRGFYPEESFYIKDQKPVSVMIWGAIGPGGWKSKLIKVVGHVNSKKYIQIVDDSGVVQFILHGWGGRCYYQQDNAPSHSSLYSRAHLARRFPFILTWPAKSPDLSPIEQIWAWIKRQIAGRSFRNKDELFAAIEELWNSMSPDFIMEFYTSFNARCIVCYNNQGESLNGKWTMVKRVHNQYRNNLRYVF